MEDAEFIERHVCLFKVTSICGGNCANESVCWRQIEGFHAGGTFGGDRHHRRSRRHPSASIEQGASIRQDTSVQVEPPPDRPCPPDVYQCQSWLLSARN